MARPTTVRLLIFVVATCLAIIGCSSVANDSAQQVDPELIDIGGGIDDAVVEGDTLWIAVANEVGNDQSTGQADHEIELVHFDLSRRTEINRAPLPNYVSAPLMHHQDSLWFVPFRPVEGIPFLFEPERIGSNDTSVVRVNPDTLTPEHQIHLDTVDPSDILFYEDSVWSIRGGMSQYSLTTGERTASGRGTPSLFSSLQIIEDTLWRTDNTFITKVDPQDGDTLAEIELNADPGLFDSRVKFYNGKHWLSGLIQDDQDNALELNPDTAELSNPTPLENFPTHTFESDDTRWELYNDRWLTEWPSVDDGGTWHRVDLATGETIGQYHFGEWIPFHEQHGALWLRSEQGLGRVGLENLDS